jgi:hypothetical protein
MVGQRRVGVPDGDGRGFAELWTDRDVSIIPIPSSAVLR